MFHSFLYSSNPGTDCEPDGLSMHVEVRHDWSDLAAAAADDTC